MRAIGVPARDVPARNDTAAVTNRAEIGPMDAVVAVLVIWRPLRPRIAVSTGHELLSHEP